jgi:hypothetical protein
VVFGVSSDPPEKNAEFAKAQRLPFLLLTDPSSILRKVGGGGGGCRAARRNDRPPLRTTPPSPRQQPAGRPRPRISPSPLLPTPSAPTPHTHPSPTCPQTFGIQNDLFVLPGRQTYVFDPNGKVGGAAGFP